MSGSLSSCGGRGNSASPCRSVVLPGMASFHPGLESEGQANQDGSSDKGREKRASRNAEPPKAQAQNQHTITSTHESFTLAEPQVRGCRMHSAHDDEKGMDTGRTEELGLHLQSTTTRCKCIYHL